MDRKIGFSIRMVMAAFAAVVLLAGNALAITWTPGFVSSTHTVSQSSTSTTVTVSWSAMTPTTGFSSDAYVYVWDNTSNTSLAANKNPSGTYAGNLSGTSLTRTLVSGTWYLHMRAVDTGAYWTDTTVHFGPIIIDAEPEPEVTGITPSSGSNSSSSVDVTLTGRYFKKLDGSAFTSVTAKIGTTSLTNITVNSATSLTGTYAIQNKTADAYDVTVTTDWGTSVALADGFTVSNPSPTVTAVSPTSGANDAERTVTITGTNFLSTSTTPPATGNPTVQMKDPDNPGRNFSLTSVSVTSKTQLTAKVPSGRTAGTYDIVVTNSDGKSGTGTDLYQVKNPAPTVTAVSPGTGANDAGTTITITGTNFQTSGTTVVTLEATGLSTITCTSVTANSSTQITATVPSNKTIGTYSVKVTNPDSQSASLAGAFTVINPTPTVSAISPASMTNDGTQSVTITGTKFRSGATVKIGTTACTAVSVASATSLTATVPAGISAATYDVKVQNVGTEAGTLAGGFTVNAATTSVALTYSASDTGSVPAGDLMITATFTTSLSAAPLISINQQGDTDVTDAAMTATADDTVWTYTYTVHSAADTGYDDGAATVTVKRSTGSAVSITSGSTFTIDTTVMSATLTYAQSSNTTGPFKAGAVTITATLNQAATAPTISINQQGSTDITDAAMSGSGTSWTYTYTVNTKDGSAYKDGTATVTLKKQDASGIVIGSGGTFTIDTTAPTVPLTYAQGGNTSGPFTAGTLTITATFSESLSTTPQIAIDQPGTTDITATAMSGSARVWTYAYTVTAASTSGYDDGTATVTITGGADTAGNTNAAATNNSFTIDTSTSVAINAVTSPTTSNAQTISGTRESGSTVTVTVTSPVTAGSVTYPTSTTWQCAISSLQAGANTITVGAEDGGGNTAQAETSITYSLPAATLTGAPTGVINTGSATITVGGTAVTYYKYHVNTDGWSAETTVATPISLSGMTDGDYTLYVIGKNSSGDWQTTATTATWSVLLDVTPPTATIVNPPSGTTNVTDYSITVGGADVTTYKYKLDDGAWSSETAVATPITLSSGDLTTDGQHTLYVVGKDSSDNWQQDADATTATWTLDTAAPTATLSNAPADGSTVGTTSVNITVGGTGVQFYKYRLDSGSWSTARAVSTALALSSLTATAHTLDVIGSDAAGNWQADTSPTSVSWTIDTSTPTAELSDTPANPSASDSATITVSGVVTYKYKLDSDAWSVSEIDVATPIELTGLSDASHTLSVIGKNDLGTWQLEGAATTYTWVVDATAPTAPTLVAAAGTPAATVVQLSWNVVEDGLQRYLLRYDTSTITDETDWAQATPVFVGMTPGTTGGTEMFNVTGLAPNTAYYFAVKAVDASGNTSAMSNGVSQTTANTRPSISALSATTGDNSVARTLTLTGANFVVGTGNTVRFVGETGTFEKLSSSASLTSLNVSVPAGAPVDVYQLKVVNANGSSELFTSQPYTVTAATSPMPEVTAVTPPGAVAGTTVTLVIDGDNFTGATTIKLVKAGVTALTKSTGLTITDTQITAASMALGSIADGQYDIQVTTPAGSNTVSAAKFEIFTPVDLSTATGTTTTSEGVDMPGDGIVPVTVVLSTASQEETAAVTANPVTIDVTLTPGTEIKTAGDAPYTGTVNPPRQVPPPAAVVSSVGANAVVFTMGSPTEQLQLGTNQSMFVELDMAMPSALPQPSVYYLDSQDNLTLAGVSGTHNGQSIAVGGTVLSSQADAPESGYTTYTIGVLLDHMSEYVGAPGGPSVTSVSPNEGSAAGGTAITISGGNFADGASVTIGGAAATSVSVASASSLTCTTPAGTEGTANVVVTNPDQQSATLANGFTYVPAVQVPTPSTPNDGATVSSLTPALATSDITDTSVETTVWQISTDNAFGTNDLVLEAEKITSLSSMAVPEMLLSGGTTYFWRVKSLDTQGAESSWSTTRSFITPVDTVTRTNGIPTDLYDATLDVDGNGTLDTQESIKSMADVGNGDYSGVDIGLKAATNATLDNIDSLEPADISDTTGTRPTYLPFGLVSFKLNVTNSDQEVQVVVYFSQAAPANAIWYKYDTANGWYDYSNYATFSSDRTSVTIRLKDGSYGDADGLKNGVIIDPSGLGVASLSSGATPAPVASSGGGGGGCFVDSARGDGPIGFNLDLLMALSLTALLAFGLSIIRRLLREKTDAVDAVNE